MSEEKIREPVLPLSIERQASLVEVCQSSPLAPNREPPKEEADQEEPGPIKTAESGVPGLKLGSQEPEHLPMESVERDYFEKENKDLKEEVDMDEGATKAISEFMEKMKKIGK